MTRYVDEVFPGPPLQPAEAQGRKRGLAERVPRQVFLRRTARRENIDGYELVIDALFVERETHGTHVEAL
jgi:hypothetical protein